MMLPRDVFMKMAAIVYTKYSADGTRHGANSPPITSPMGPPSLAPCAAPS
jgi:hypothetical protein